jgi:hypothetical protein
MNDLRALPERRFSKVRGAAVTVLLTLGLSVGSALPAMAETTGVTVTGKVSFDFKGGPVSGLKVCPGGEDSGCTTTDAEGVYTLTNATDWGLGVSPSAFPVTDEQKALFTQASYSYGRYSDVGAPRYAAVSDGRAVGVDIVIYTGKLSVASATSPVASAKPSITGSAKVGKKLTAKVTKTSGVKVAYQWYLNGKKISKATKSTLKVAKSYRGKKVTVKVTFTKKGYVSVVKTSAPKKVR